MSRNAIRYWLPFVLMFSFASLAHATEFVISDGDSVVGEISHAQIDASETLLDLGRRMSLGYVEMALANRDIDMWLPEANANVRLPGQYVLPTAARSGIVLNLAEYRLYYYPPSESGRVMSYPTSIGRMDWETPLGKTRVVAKAKNPSWYPPASVRAEHREAGDPLPSVVPPGPDNPLGRYALRLGLPGYLIHGTNKPAGVGMRVTHGCLRLFPEDIESLYSVVKIGLPVLIVNQPIKFGWLGDELYLEVHPPLDTAGVSEEESALPLTSAAHELTALTRAVASQLKAGEADLDWTLAEAALLKADGIPVVVGRRRTVVSPVVASP